MKGENFSTFHFFDEHLKPFGVEVEVGDEEDRITRTYRYRIVMEPDLEVPDWTSIMSLRGTSDGVIGEMWTLTNTRNDSETPVVFFRFNIVNNYLVDIRYKRGTTEIFFGGLVVSPRRFVEKIVYILCNHHREIDITFDRDTLDIVYIKIGSKD